jgi:hypothetical protein
MIFVNKIVDRIKNVENDKKRKSLTIMYMIFAYPLSLLCLLCMLLLIMVRNIPEFIEDAVEIFKLIKEKTHSMWRGYL